MSCHISPIIDQNSTGASDCHGDSHKDNWYHERVCHQSLDAWCRAGALDDFSNDNKEQVLIF